MPVMTTFKDDGAAPVKVWTKEIEDSALKQLHNLATLPFIHRHVAVMPDVHWGMGSTVGSVIPTLKAIVPAAVGVDIGCGMVAHKLSVIQGHSDGDGQPERSGAAAARRYNPAPMPFYEYECSNCKFYTEMLQKVSDPPLRKCPSCGKSQMKKLVSAPNFRLKGGGWYETDFKSDQENKRNLAVDKEPEGKSSEDSSKKADDAKAGAKAGEGKPAAESKPEAKPEKTAAGSSGDSISSRRSSVRRAAPAKKKLAAKSASKRRARR